ncbi:MAG TPA: amino acid ABC transporter permease, partial [Dehalococcoidia bacterium]|nr:amino acid ABC transporter permease [Dehalococcoidia bacterium]
LKGSILTVIGLYIAILIFIELFKFIFINADWEVVIVNFRLLILGRFPIGQEWRLIPSLILSCILIGMSISIWSKLNLINLILLILILYIIFAVFLSGFASLIIGIAIISGCLAYVLSNSYVLFKIKLNLLKKITIYGWILLLPLTLILLNINGGIGTERWGGVFLNIMLAAIGISGGIIFGPLLALGRNSNFKSIKYPCIACIEFIRAAPLIGWLFLARFVLPSLLPSLFELNKIDIVIRAMIVLVVFSSAYIAEIVRGGLQSLPKGQREAGMALGLNEFNITWFIIIPQAIRAVIPALVSQFIALWKDTTLVYALSLTELLGAANAAVAQPDFVGKQIEVFLFIAVIFWTFSYIMSRISSKMETRLGLGKW